MCIVSHERSAYWIFLALEIPLPMSFWFRGETDLEKGQETPRVTWKVHGGRRLLRGALATGQCLILRAAAQTLPEISSNHAFFVQKMLCCKHGPLL